MTDAEKTAFFDKHLKRMEKRLSETTDEAKKARINQKIEEFKATPDADKAQFLKDNKKKKGKRGNKDHKKKPDLKSMTDAEKIAFFDKHLKRMESRIKKIDNPKKVIKIKENLETFKALDLKGKEDWLKKNHKKMKGMKKHLKRMCDKIASNPKMELPSYEEALKKLTSSKMYKKSDNDTKEIMMVKFKKIQSKSVEERTKMFEKRINNLKERCENARPSK